MAQGSIKDIPEYEWKLISRAEAKAERYREALERVLSITKSQAIRSLILKALDRKE